MRESHVQTWLAPLTDLPITSVSSGKHRYTAPVFWELTPGRNLNSWAASEASIREFGFRQPIVVDEESVIIVGHSMGKRKAGNAGRFDSNIAGVMQLCWCVRLQAPCCLYAWRRRTLGQRESAWRQFTTDRVPLPQCPPIAWSRGRRRLIENRFPLNHSSGERGQSAKKPQSRLKSSSCLGSNLSPSLPIQDGVGPDISPRLEGNHGSEPAGILSRAISSSRF